MAPIHRSQAPALPTAGGPIGSLVDGLPCDAIPVWDRGIAYGDGVFETILIRDGNPCQWSRHLDRLSLGCRRLGFPLPSAASLAAEARSLVSCLTEGVLKILITRGVGGRGYCPPTDPRPRRILSAYPAPPAPRRWFETGVRVRYCRTPATANSALAGIKHLNRLDSVLARAEWDDPATAEGLMLTEGGEVVGGTMTNLFLWDGESLKTPRLDRAGIAGTVRALTLELAPAFGLPCTEQALTAGDLARARGLFLTNALIGVWPVGQLADTHYDLSRLPQGLIDCVSRVARTTESLQTPEFR